MDAWRSWSSLAHSGFILESYDDKTRKNTKEHDLVMSAHRLLPAPPGHTIDKILFQGDDDQGNEITLYKISIREAFVCL